MTTQPRKPSYRIQNGLRMPMGFPREALVSGISYQAQPEDTFIVTYPKCGTTWTQYIVWLLQHDGKPMSAEKSMREEMPHLEEVGKDKIANLSIPRVIKTHLPFSLTPYHLEAKYIYVARNPFDCAVSFYHHTRGFIKHYDFAEGTFDEFFECFLTGEVDFGDYFDHLLSWYERKDDNNVLLLIYEEMKADPRTAIAQIAEFLGTGYCEKIKDKEIVKRILFESSMARMSQNQERWSSKRPENMPPFIRKGQVGDWKNYFTAEQAKRLKEKFLNRTKGTGLERLWSGIIPIIS